MSKGAAPPNPDPFHKLTGLPKKSEMIPAISPTIPPWNTFPTLILSGTTWT